MGSPALGSLRAGSSHSRKPRLPQAQAPSPVASAKDSYTLGEHTGDAELSLALPSFPQLVRTCKRLLLPTCHPLPVGVVVGKGQIQRALVAIAGPVGGV